MRLAPRGLRFWGLHPENLNLIADFSYTKLALTLYLVIRETPEATTASHALWLQNIISETLELHELSFITRV